MHTLFRSHSAVDVSGRGVDQGAVRPRSRPMLVRRRTSDSVPVTVGGVRTELGEHEGIER